MPAPSFVARGSIRHVFASTLALVLGLLGLVVLAVGIAVGPVGAVLGVGFAALLAWQTRRLARLRIAVDDRGAPEAALRHGPDGRETLALAAIAGGIVQRTAGTTYRGLRTGADVEHWLLVGHDGRALRRIDGRGFSPDDLAAARRRIGGTWMSLVEARRAGLLPADAPWDMRHPGVASAVALGAVLATIGVIVAICVVLARIGRDAFVWPWW